MKLPFRYENATALENDLAFKTRGTFIAARSHRGGRRSVKTPLRDVTSAASVTSRLLNLTYNELVA